MRAVEFITEDVGVPFYHVAQTKNVKNIQAKGILPMQTSNWVQAGNKERYGDGSIFAFEHMADAARWAAKWDWELSKMIGSGKVSVITFKDDPANWEEDVADPLGQAGAKGKWLKKHGSVSPKNIQGVTAMTGPIIRSSLNEDISHSSLQLELDNPGGSWEAHEQHLSQESGRQASGAPKRFGSVTGSFSRKVELPVDKLAAVPGIMGEQSNVRDDSLQWLLKTMKETGKLPLAQSGKEHAPFIQVDYQGNPWVNEGNHRIMAAKKLGWSHIPTEVRYFAGGENVEGDWSPKALIALDSQLQGKAKIVSEAKAFYKEVEFVCANPEFANASDPKKQKILYGVLKKMPGVIPMMQDWGDGQISLAAIYKDPALQSEIIAAGKQTGILIDLIRPVTGEYVDRALRGEHEGQIR